jgi:hypothetical protein
MDINEYVVSESDSDSDHAGASGGATNGRDCPDGPPAERDEPPPRKKKRKQGPPAEEAKQKEDGSKGKPAKTWMMTLNNPTEDEKTDCVDYAKMNCTRAVIALEEGESGTPHLQMRMSFKYSKRFSALKKQFPRAWIAIAKVECFSYEMKLGSKKLLVLDKRQAGHRSDIDDFRDDIIAGLTPNELAMKHAGCYFRYKNMVDHIKTIFKPTMKSEFDPTTFIDPLDFSESKSIVLWGPPGVGKTQYAMSHFKKPLWVNHMDALANLADHDGIVFDDMDFKHLPRSSCIFITDWEMERQVHFRYQTATIPENMRRIFTTNIRDGAIFGDSTNDDAIIRRVKYIEVKSTLKEPTEKMKDAIIKYYGYL